MYCKYSEQSVSTGCLRGKCNGLAQPAAREVLFDLEPPPPGLLLVEVAQDVVRRERRVGDVLDVDGRERLDELGRVREREIGQGEVRERDVGGTQGGRGVWHGRGHGVWRGRGRGVRLARLAPRTLARASPPIKQRRVPLVDADKEHGLPPGHGPPPAHVRRWRRHRRHRHRGRKRDHWRSSRRPAPFIGADAGKRRVALAGRVRLGQIGLPRGPPIRLNAYSSSAGAAPV
ncbi:uncharacterized protein V1510DRAFT_243754 [Dipodascopsis tothii]|uniref:uncharacterized protein n=1 Tax=Dipodascopsis tothii TaxID=44089 RepID=UPI0034CDEF71